MSLFRRKPDSRSVEVSSLRPACALAQSGQVRNRLPFQITCTSPVIGTGSVGISISKMLKFSVKVFICDGQEAVRQAILIKDRSC